MNCPKCNSSHISHRGIRHNKQRYQCQKCYKYFNGEILIKEISDDFPAVLVMDIETLPILGYVWAAFDTNLIRVKEDWCVACWSAKWWGDNRVMSDVMTIEETKTRNDKRICETLWKLFESADVIIGQNVKGFDFKKMNTRWWYYKMGPPSSFKPIDTLETARKMFLMTFNNLDYLANYLGIGKKKETGGFDLWEDFMCGDQEARKNMVEYCENDTILDEKVYDTMRPWVYNHPKFSVYKKVIGVCPICFSTQYKEIGYYQAPVQKYKEFRCSNCQSLWHLTKIEK